uniref:U20-Hypotoxin-Hsp1a_1 n=1 Tax=Hypochilus sp. SGP-2016 TaxID=1905178 RepID=A0A482ZBK3_9ARAC
MYRYALLVLVALTVSARADEEETDCQRERRQMQSSSALVIWDVRCDENGDYEALRCTVDTPKWCACYRRDGTPITQASRRITTCTCYTEKDEKERNAASTCDVPSCQKSGKYEKKQTCSSTGKSHCVNEDSGERTSEPSTGEVEC